MRTFKLFNFNLRSSAMVQADGCTAARPKIGVTHRTTSTIGRFASVLCLILTMLFTLGVGVMGAGPTFNGGYVYFYNKGGWSDSYKQLCIGKSDYTETRTMTVITNTKLWYNSLPSSGWGDATYMAVVGNSSSWGSGSWGTSNLTNANHRTGAVDLGNWGFGSGNVNMLTPANGNNDAALTLSYVGNSSSSLNITITIAAKVSTDNGGSYSANTAHGKLTGSSKTFSNYTTCGTSSSATLNDGSSSTTMSCGYTAETVLTAADKSGYSFKGWYDASGNRLTTAKNCTIYVTEASTYYAYYNKLYTISASSTVVWDLCGNEKSWSAVYLYRDIEGGSATNDAFTQCGTTTQYRKTYASAVNNIKVWLFRAQNGSTWSDYKQTTDIYRDVSGVTLYEFDNTLDGKKLNWQVTENAKKATSGTKVYFDNTNANWGEIWLKYGTTRFNRHTGAAATKVNGTDNLYVITMPEAYYVNWYFASSYGWTDRNTIVDTHVGKRIPIQSTDLTSDITFVPTGSTSGSAPTQYAVESFTGHTRRLTFGSHTNGQITVRYTDESGVEQTVSSASASYVDVAQTCNVIITAVPNSGYAPSGLTLNSSSITSGATQTIRADGTIVATFVAEETHDVTVSYMYGDRELHADATFEVGVTTPSNISSETIDGFQFSSWSNLTNVTNNTGNLTTDPISINSTTADGSMTCNYTPWSCSLDLVASEGATGYSSRTAMSYDATAKAYYLNRTTASATERYRFYINSIEYAPSALSTELPIDETKVTASTNVTGYASDKPSVYFNDGGSGSNITIWFDYENKKAWVTEQKHTVSVTYGAHGSVDVTEVTAGAVAKSALITATPDPGYFVSWDIPTGVTIAEGTETSPTIKINATADDKTITANFAEQYILRGSKDATGDPAGGMAGWTATSNSSYTLVTIAGSVLTIQATLEANTRYKFKVWDMKANAGHGQTGTSEIVASSTSWTLNGGNDVYLKTSSSDNTTYTFIIDISGDNPVVAIAFPGQFLSGDFTNWGIDQDNIAFDANGLARVNLTAGNHKFKVIYEKDWYGKNDFTVTTTTLDQQLSTSGADCNITVTTAGEYLFGWDATHKKISVFTPSDAAKATLTKSRHIYFDARKLGTTGDGWRSADFTARFWLKNVASAANINNGDDCTHAQALEDWVYYVTVPDNDAVGRVQIDRYVGGSYTNCSSNVAHAYTRTDALQNCLAEDTGHENYCNNWNPSWTTYCPPMRSAMLSDNSTSVISWTSGDGSSGNPYLVPVDGTIQLSASATKALEDANMTINYDFKVNGSSEQAGATSTFNKGSLSNNTTYTMTLQAYNTYNGESGTKLTASQTLYYKALNMYSVTNTLTHMSSDGRSGSGAAAYGLGYSATLSVSSGYSLPTTITVKRGETTLTPSTHYTYNSSTGALSINAAQVSGNITIIAAGVPNSYTVTLNNQSATSAGTESIAVTFDANTNLTSAITEPVKTGYAFGGYYTATGGGGTQIIDADGNVVASAGGGSTYTDASKNWKYANNITLYAKWTAVTTVAADPNLDICQVTGLFGLSDYACQGLDGRCAGATETIGSKDTRHMYGITGGDFFTNDLEDAPARDRVHFEVWASEAFTFTLRLAGYNSGFVYSGTQNYTTTAGSWTVIDVPLSNFTDYANCFANKFTGFNLTNLGNKDIWFANVYLYTTSSACAAVPAVAPSAPTYPACQVHSIYSDTYASVGMSYDAWGSGSSKTDETVGGTHMYKVTVNNGNFGGLIINGKIDASSYEYIHMDVWTPLASTFRFSPICWNYTSNNKETEQYRADIATTAATWTSIDIPVSYFTALGLTMRGNYQLKIDQYTGTYFWITNIYYYNTSSCPSYTPEVGAHHFGTAQRQNVALYSDADMATGRHANTSKPLAQRFDYYIVDCGEQMLSKVVTRGKLGTGAYDQMVQVWNNAKTAFGENKLSQHNAAATIGFQRIGDADQYNWNGQTTTAPMNFYMAFQEQTTGLGYSEFFNYQRGYINNPNSDETAPTLTSVASTSETNWFTLTFTGGNDNSGQWFYYIEDTEFDYYKVSLEDTIRIPKVDNGQIFHFNCYAVDFNGNMSAAKPITIEMPYTSPSTTNLALKKPITIGAGSYEARANDGSLTSRMEGADSEYANQWLYIDLQGYYNLSTVKIWFQAASSDNFVLQAAHTLPATIDDDTQWRTIYTNTSTPHTGNAVGDVNTYNVSGSTARYIRLKSYHNTTGYGVSIWEFEVYGSAVTSKDVTAPTVSSAEASAIVNGDDLQLTLTASDGSKFFRIIDTDTEEKFLLEADGSNHVVLTNKTYNYCTTYNFAIQAMDAAANLSAATNLSSSVAVPALYNLATGATATAGHVSGGDIASAAVDGNSLTRWSSNGGSSTEHWITVDLQRRYAVSSVKLSWETACSKNYYLKASLDGTHFYPVGHYTTAPATTSDGSTYETYTMPSGIEARYLQMYSVENNTGYGTSIFEFEAYGACATNGTTPIMTFAEIYDLPISSYSASAEINVGAWDDATAFDALTYRAVFTAGKSETINGLTATDGILTLSGLTTGTTYTVRIYAVDGSSNVSANYKELTFTPKVNLYYLTGDDTGTTGAWQGALSTEESAAKRRFSATAHDGIYHFSISVLGDNQQYRPYYDVEGNLVFANDNDHWSVAGNQVISGHSGETINVYAKDKDHFVSNFDEVYVYGAAIIGATTEGSAARMSCVSNTFTWEGFVASGTNAFRIIVKENGSSFTDHSRARIMTAAANFVNSSNWTYAKLTFDMETWSITWAQSHFVIYRTDDKADDPHASSGCVESYAGGTISGVIEYRMKVRALDQWYSLYLPFDVDSVRVWDAEDKAYYAIQPYYRPDVGGQLYQGHYYIRTPRQVEELPLADFGDWRDPSTYVFTPLKKTPYIIQWHSSYFLNRYVSFFGHSAAAIPTSMTVGEAPDDENVVNIYGNDAMITGSVTDAYTLDGEYGSGAWLRNKDLGTDRTVLPFECYMLVCDASAGRYLVISRDMRIEDTVTSLDAMVRNSEQQTLITVYTLSGVRVTQYSNCSLNDAANQLQNSISEGIYILHTDNESVKLIVGGK